jgi:hypothetical protein
LSLLTTLTAIDAQLSSENIQAVQGVLNSPQNKIEELIRNALIDGEIGLELMAAIDALLMQLRRCRYDRRWASAAWF